MNQENQTVGMPNPLKVWSIGLGLGQLVLLSVTFEDHQTDMVSTNLMEFPQFNIWLTMTVTAQIVTSGLYMAVMRNRSLPAFLIATIACILALVGWAMLSVYNLHTTTQPRCSYLHYQLKCLLYPHDLSHLS